MSVGEVDAVMRGIRRRRMMTMEFRREGQPRAEEQQVSVPPNSGANSGHLRGETSLIGHQIRSYGTTHGALGLLADCMHAGTLFVRCRLFRLWAIYLRDGILIPSDKSAALVGIAGYAESGVRNIQPETCICKSAQMHAFAGKLITVSLGSVWSACHLISRVLMFFFLHRHLYIIYKRIEIWSWKESKLN